MSKRAMRWWGVVVLLAVASGVIYFTQDKKEISEVNSVPQEKESPEEGFLAPQFALYDLNGKMVSLRDFRGKVILLNFWATWCPPCKREIPSLERLYQIRKDKNFEVLAVNVDRGSHSQIASFAEKQRMSFPILLNSEGGVGDKYQVQAIPTSFLLDKKGVIRWKIRGAIEWDDPSVLSRIDQLLVE